MVDQSDQVPDAVDALHRLISQEVEGVVNSILGPAQLALQPHKVAYVLMRVTANLGRAGTLYSLQVKRDDRTPEQMCDMWIASLSAMLLESRPAILAKYEALKAEGKTLG
ncbi:hypothetical protein [Sphingomonas yabuuchiae]|uniref:Uncharacterized protein n=1 Tax=Sphingomonas yabuuchiae TaxID=172044 RepID=A0AA40ZZF3_9SPHN|nr:hypothetical protein [Sphingomonas yabuuchiae]MBB4609621.1 hypothetical protein [Sphingomonas yabuuchiae]MBN3557934.1 hypothetical protein [Sphingomonas yabuuchiae]